jgi:outer membrane lipoprotein SlyB
MEAAEKNRLHPLLTAAAISVTVFSAVGIGAMTGLLPSSVGSSKEAAPVQLVGAAPQATTAQASAAAPATRPSEMPPATPAATPKPVKKTPAPRASTPRPAQPLPVARDFGTSAPLAQAPVAPAQAEARKPVPAGLLGVVEAVREVKQPAEKSNGVGPIAGGIAGAVIGNQFGHGTTKSVLTVLGAAGGAFAGKEIERNVRSTKQWEISVRLDDGSHRTLTSDAQPFWNAGDRVRMVDGTLQPV